MRVAVFGAGYAGITLARRIERRLPDVDLLVVDENGRHLVQHELHRVVRRPELATRLELPLSELLERATVREDRVVEVDPEARLARTAAGDEIGYDVGAVCLGAETAFYGLDGVREHATPLKRLEHAHRIRETFLDEVADGRVVVGGAGLSGIQVAGELAALADEEGREATVTLLEQQAQVAPTFGDRFAAAVRDALDEAGVEVRTGATVADADAAAVVLDGGERLSYEQFVWTGGIAGPDAMGGDRPQVRATLDLDDRTFVLGDAARGVDRDGEPVPATAQAAVAAAEVVADAVERIVEHDDDAVFDPRLPQFNFESRGWAVSVGDRNVAQVGSQVLRGAPARAAKATVGLTHLTGVGAVEDAVAVAYEELGLVD
jgi:NADH dehydrogenase